MKITHDDAEEGTHIVIAGDVDSSVCNCIESYWRCHIDDETAALTLHLDELDQIDGIGVATLVNIIRCHLDRGTPVTITRAPQMLAHTLYKTAMLNRPNLQLVEPRYEEPYGD